MNNHNELKPSYNDTNYQDFDDYYEKVKKSSEEGYTESKKVWETCLKQFRQANQILIANKVEPIKLNQVLARRQFYRNNNLPGELNVMIEKYITTEQNDFWQNAPFC